MPIVRDSGIRVTGVEVELGQYDLLRLIETGTARGDDVTITMDEHSWRAAVRKIQSGDYASPE